MPETACPTGAWSRIMLEPMIDPLRCTMCGQCIPACPHDAIESVGKVSFRRRMVDANVVELLRGFRGTVVLENPRHLLHTLRRYTTRLPELRVEQPEVEDND